MNELRLGLFLFFTQLLFAPALAQKITFSERSKKDGHDIYFEILGRFDSSYYVYKNVRQKHVITQYNQQMGIVKEIPLDFVPERTFNIDFITYPEYCLIIYQYQRNSIIHCKAAKLRYNDAGKTEPFYLDTTRISVLADNKIYTTIYSEDRKKILLYKRQLKDEVYTLMTKLYDAELTMLDSARQSMNFDERRHEVSDLALDNNGCYLFAKQTAKVRRRDKGSELEVILHRPGMESFRNYKVALGEKIIEDATIKVDNLNTNYIINSFYYGETKGRIEGLFTALIDMNGTKPIKAAFNSFTDSLRLKMNSSDRSRFAFDNLVIHNITVKRNGGFMVSAEDHYTETLYNNAWNRRYFNTGMPYTNTYDYYLGNPYLYGYRPYDGLRRNDNVRYYYDDIVTLSLDSNLSLQWNTVIHKKQYDVNDDNALSYTNMLFGGEIHYLFIDKQRQRELISNHSIMPNGAMRRYPTLKSSESGYRFLPRLAKQVGAREMIMPCSYMNSIAFAKIEF